MTNMWDLESLVKAKVKLKNILIDRHIEVDEEDTLSDLVDKVAKIGKDTLVNRLVSDELTEYKNDKVTTIASNTFYTKNAIQNVDVPNVTSIAGGAFQSCGLREFVDYSAGVFTGSPVFADSAYIKRIIVPFFKNTSSYQFARSCVKLELIDIDFNFTVYDGFVSACTVLKTLIIRSSSLCPLSTVNAFTNTPIKLNTGGYIYVPEIMVERYRTATNWSLMASRIIKLEGTIYEDPYWSAKESVYIDVDSVEYELPKDTTVLQFKNTYQIENMYSDGQIMNDEDVLYDFKDTEITTEVK